MDELREQVLLSALLSAAVALTLISEKARFQAARTTDEEAKLSLTETDAHCKTALRIIQDARADSATTACPTCEYIRTKHGGFGPSHDGSKMCESGSIASGGQIAHCSCDTCF